MKAVDLFAGWGGFSTGARQAGVDVLWAANHWPLAVAVHELNHPGTKHACQDLRQADWTSLPKYDLLLASPACQGHSEASQPQRRVYHDGMRATAWAVVDCAEVTRPKVFIVENVPQFVEWELYDLWLAALSRLGYNVTKTIVRASYCGAPQRRDRLFIVGSRKRHINLNIPVVKEPAFGPYIDWTAPGWRPISECRGENARKRFAAAANQYDYAMVQHVTGHRGIGIDEPIRTVTTKDQWCVLAHGQYRPLTIREHARAMGFPEQYTWPIGLSRQEAIRGIGNAVAVPVARKVVEQVAEAA